MTKHKTPSLILSAVISVAVLVYALGFASFAESLTVKGDATNVRASAGSSGEVLAKVNKGDIVEKISEKTDSAGELWYEVKTSNGTTGYIRSDLLTGASQTSTPGSSAPSSGVNTKEATIIGDGTNIRSSQSTESSANIVAKLNKGDTVNVVSQSSDKVWYKVTFTQNGDQKTGYIHSNLVTFASSLTDTQITPSDIPEEVDVNGDGVIDELDLLSSGEEEADPEQTPSEAEDEARPSNTLGFTLLTPPSEPENLPKEFTAARVQLGDAEEDCWRYGDFLLLYAQKDSGEVGFYVYDTTEKVLQRYFAIDTKGSGSAYVILIAALSVLVVLLIAVVVILMLRARRGSRYDDDSPEDFIQISNRGAQRPNTAPKVSEVYNRRASNINVPDTPINPNPRKQPTPAVNRGVEPRQNRVYEQQSKPGRNFSEVNKKSPTVRPDKEDLVYLDLED